MSPKRIQRPNIVGSSLVQDTTGQAVAQGISGVGKQLGAISDALLKAKTDRDNATAKQMSSRDVTQDELKLKKYSNKLSADSEASGEWDDNADLMNAYQEKVYNERLASERGGNETYRQSYSTFYRLPATYAIGDVIRKQEAGRNRSMISGLNEDLDQHISTMNAENFSYAHNMGLGVIDSYPSLNTKMMEGLYSSKLSAHILEMAKNPETSAEAIAIMNSPQGQDLFSGKSDAKKAVYAAADNSADLYSAQAEAKLSVEMLDEKKRLSTEMGNHTPIEVLVNEINSNPALDKAEKDELLAHIGQSKSGSSGSGSGSGSKLSQADTKKRYTSELGVLNTQLTEALKIDGTKDMRKEVNSVIEGITNLEAELFSGDLNEADTTSMALTMRTARQKALYALTDGKTVDTDPKRFLPLGQDHTNKISRKSNETPYPYMNSMNLEQRQQYIGIFQRKLLQELDNYPKGDKIGEEESNALIKGLHEQSLMEMMGEENYEVFVNGKVKQAPSTNDADALTFYSNGLNAGMSHEQLAELFIENNNAPREQSEAQIGRVLNQIRMNEMQESADWQGPTQTAINPQSTYDIPARITSEELEGTVTPTENAIFKAGEIEKMRLEGKMTPTENAIFEAGIKEQQRMMAKEQQIDGVGSKNILDGEPAQLGRTEELFSGVQSADTFDGRIESEDLLDTRITQGDTVVNKEQQNAQETKPKGSVNPDGSDFQYATIKKVTPKEVEAPYEDQGPQRPVEVGGAKLTPIAKSIDNKLMGINEGDSEIKGYVPSENSGITIASGFDLKDKTPNVLELMGMPQEIIDKLSPYMGMSGADADRFADSLEITDEEAKTIDIVARNFYTEDVKRQFNKKASEDGTGLTYESLTPAQRSVVYSVNFQYGLLTKTPKFFGYVTKGDWKNAHKELENFGDDFPTRRKREANFLLSSMPELKNGKNG